MMRFATAAQFDRAHVARALKVRAALRLADWQSCTSPSRDRRDHRLCARRGWAHATPISCAITSGETAGRTSEADFS
jgi:hypothetical protein